MAASKGISETVQLMLPSVNGPSGQSATASIKPVTLERQGNGFGFTLRHFVVYPPEVVKKGGERASIPRVNGGNHETNRNNGHSDPLDTVFVRQVAPSGPADKAGLSTGDQIISVNGRPVLGQSYGQVIQLIQTSKDKLELGIIPKEDCVLQTVTPTVSVTPTSTSVSITTVPSSDGQSRVTSTVTFNTNQGMASPKRNSAVYLKLSEPTSGSLSDRKGPEANGKGGNPVTSAGVTRRNSIDREARRENRAFVVTSSDSFEAVEDNCLKAGSFSGHNSNASPLDGSYFFAATDHTGKPIALHVEKGSSVQGDKLQVIDTSRRKTRSHSLPTVEMEGFRERFSVREGIKCKTEATIAVNQNSDPRFQSGGEMATVQLDLNANTSKVIPPFVLSAPRTSDSLSTSNVTTNADTGSRQPVATHRPGMKESASFLSKTLESCIHQQRSPQSHNFKSTTIGSTLLESKPVQKFSISQETPTPFVTTNSNSDITPSTKALTTPTTVSSFVIPSKHSYQEVTSSFSIYPNEIGEMSIVETHKDAMPISQNREQPSRRISYLMATQSGAAPQAPSLSGPKLWSASKKPHLAAALSSTLFQPVMVQTPSGNDASHNSTANENGEGTMECSEEEEVFSERRRYAGEGYVSAPRPTRRISYVMATSSPTSPKHLSAFDDVNEEAEELSSAMKLKSIAQPENILLEKPCIIPSPSFVSSYDHMERERINGLSANLFEVAKEGLLWKKQEADGGRRSSARSWKPVVAVLRGHVLYLYKDKSAASQGHGPTDDQPISIKSSIVDIAHDYTKRKNVFRLITFNGSEYLFQTEDKESMMSWIGAIQANNNPDEDERGVTSQSLIIRKMKNVEHENSQSSQTGHKLSPPTGSKMSSISNLKKSLSFKNISGGQSSPFSQHKKVDSIKNHWNKASKKRKKPTSPATLFPPGHSVGVPLELCPQSKVIKGVPMIVEHCTCVIERKGVDTVGVYRVPGNSAAVSALVEELNTKGAENVNFQEDKWNDVNNNTSLLKQMLRNLPEGLVTADLYDNFLDANKKEDPVERMWALKCLIHDLPEHHFETLKHLLFHLRAVSENASKNKMEARNLAIVFGPTLVRSGEDTMMSMVKDMSDQCRIVETLITHCEWFYDNSGDGENSANKLIPFEVDLPQEQLVSQNVLLTLGQAAENMSEDRSHKAKGHPPHTFPKPKIKHPRLEPASSYNGNRSGGHSPEERSPLLHRTVSEPASSPTLFLDKADHGAAKKSDPEPATAGNVASFLEVIDDTRAKGGAGLPKFTPRAYSYAHPPPPSYRKVSSGSKRPVSPSDGKEGVSNEGGVSSESEHPGLRHDSESPTDAGHAPKPNFASLSEQTRLRLLKVSLQQKAAEKKQRERESMSSSPISSPVTTPVSEHPPVPVSEHQRGRVDRVSESPEQLKRKTSDPLCDSTDPLSSSSSNSRSSSAPSSKNASLDSLHHVSQQNQPPWVPRKPDTQAHHPQDVPQQNQPPRVHNKPNVQAHQVLDAPQQRQPPWLYKAPVSQAHKSQDQSHRLHQTQDHGQTGQQPQVQGQREFSKGPRHQTETTIEVVQGKGIVTKTPNTYDAPRRPASSDIRARRESAEEMRLGRGSLNSESSDSSDSEGDEGFALSMSKTFDEKLRVLLDFNDPCSRGKVNGRDKPEPDEDDALSVGSDTFTGSESTLARDSTPSQNSRTSDLGFCSNPSFGTDNSRASNSSSSGYATARSSARTESTVSQASGLDGDEKEGYSRNVSFLRHQFESEAATSYPGETCPPPYSGHGSASSHTREPLPPPYSGHRDNQQLHVELPISELQINVSSRSQERRLSEERRATMGIVQTTTPVNLKELNVVKSGRQKNDPNQTTVVKVPRKSVRNQEVSAKKTEKNSITISQRSSPRSSQAEVNSYTIALQEKAAAYAQNQRGQGAADYTGRLRGGSRSRMATRQHQQILPSRGKIPGVPHDATNPKVQSQAQKKLDRNAQHIAELLEEMHSERHLKMNRQQSDISGTAQKGAAMRAAASRQRRRSLGDENSDAVLIATRVGPQCSEGGDGQPDPPTEPRNVQYSVASSTMSCPRPPARSPANKSRTAALRSERSQSYRR